MTRKATTFDTLPQAVDILLKRLDDIEAKLDSRNNRNTDKATHIFLEEAAELVGKSTSTIYKLAKSGKIPAYKNGKQLNFVKEELEAWMTRMPSHKAGILSNHNLSPQSTKEQLLRSKRGRKPSPSIF